MNAIIGQKKGMTQVFDKAGMVIPCTIVDVTDVKVVGFKDLKKDGYDACVIGKDKKTKNINKAEAGKYKDFAPKYVSEVKGKFVEKIGDDVKASVVFKEGDLIDVEGKTKGLGFQGVIAGYGMKGGPKTHGQSNKHRSIGSIASGQTFGHVAKGRRMARKFGNDKITVRNLKIVKIDDENGFVLVSGALPGMKGTYVVINKK